MASQNHTPIDTELVERTRFEQDPASCITRSTVSAAASLLRTVADYRRALGQAQETAVPEERTGLLRRTVAKPEVRGWLALELRWDVSLYDPGCYASIRAFLLDSGAVLCVVNARDRSFMFADEMPVEDFVWRFMAAWVRKDSSATDYDAAAMNRVLLENFERVYHENSVPKRPLADGTLCKALLQIMGR